MPAVPQLAIVPGALLPLNPALNVRSALGASAASAPFRNSWQSILGLLVDPRMGKIEAQPARQQALAAHPEIAAAPPSDTGTDSQTQAEVTAPHSPEAATRLHATTPLRQPQTIASSPAASVRPNFREQGVCDVPLFDAAQQATAPASIRSSKRDSGLDCRSQHSIPKSKDTTASTVITPAVSAPVYDFVASPQPTASVKAPDTNDVSPQPSAGLALVVRTGSGFHALRMPAGALEAGNAPAGSSRLDGVPDPTPEKLTTPPLSAQHVLNEAPQKISLNPPEVSAHAAFSAVRSDSNAAANGSAATTGVSAAASSDVEKISRPAEKRDATQVASSARPMHAAGTADLAPTSPYVPPPQTAPSMGGGPVTTGDFGVSHAALHAVHPEPLLSPGSAPRETFAALDGDAATSATHWIRAGTHSAEAGFEDPALGWVGVRADLNAGALHAAIVPGSVEAAQALGSHMAGLHAYLSEQRTAVDTLTLAAPTGREQHFSAGADAGRDPGQQMQQGSGEPRTAAPPSAEHRPTAAAQFDTTGRAGAQICTSSFVIAAPPQARAGSYISVMA